MRDVNILRRSSQVLAVTALATVTGMANASLTISSVVGGVPTGVNYVNFNNLSLGSAGGSSGGLTVSFASGAKAVQGASTGSYAAPYLSNSNGTLFGDPTVSGVDTTTYVATTYTAGSVSLALPGPELYFGLLWGSVDAFNTLTFFNASGQSVGSINGLAVTATANGNQGAAGTFYVNITSTLPFTKVVASGSVFELDNVAYNPTIPSVPEPASSALLALGLLGWLVHARRAASRAAATRAKLI